MLEPFIVPELDVVLSGKVRPIPSKLWPYRANVFVSKRFVAALRYHRPVVCLSSVYMGVGVGVFMDVRVEIQSRWHIRSRNRNQHRCHRTYRRQVDRQVGGWVERKRERERRRVG